MQHFAISRHLIQFSFTASYYTTLAVVYKHYYQQIIASSQNYTCILAGDKAISYYSVLYIHEVSSSIRHKQIFYALTMLQHASSGAFMSILYTVFIGYSRPRKNEISAFCGILEFPWPHIELGDIIV